MNENHRYDRQSALSPRRYPSELLALLYKFIYYSKSPCSTRHRRVSVNSTDYPAYQPCINRISTRYPLSSLIKITLNTPCIICVFNLLNGRTGTADRSLLQGIVSEGSFTKKLPSFPGLLLKFFRFFGDPFRGYDIMQPDCYPRIEEYLPDSVPHCSRMHQNCTQRLVPSGRTHAYCPCILPSSVSWASLSL